MVKHIPKQFESIENKILSSAHQVLNPGLKYLYGKTLHIPFPPVNSPLI